jgi:hypothetical protein
MDDVERGGEERVLESALAEPDAGRHQRAGRYLRQD